ncbi:MAG: response regulator [Acidobacteriota bacterium]
MARVLIAEADEPTRQQVVSFLRSAGHDVTAYSDGDAVLDHIVSGHVDIIVTDLELPGPGGLELLCRVRGSRPEIKVLLTAEKPTFESAAEAVRTGAFDFLVKPVTRQAICRAVGSAERIKALEDENRNYRNQLEELVRERTRQIREYSDRLRLVADRTRRLTSCQSLHELGVELLDLLSASLGADGGSFYVVRDNTLQLVHALDPGHQKASISLPAPEDSVIAHVFARNRGVLVETIEDSTLGIASSGWDGRISRLARSSCSMASRRFATSCWPTACESRRIVTGPSASARSPASSSLRTVSSVTSIRGCSPCWDTPSRRSL